MQIGWSLVILPNVYSENVINWISSPSPFQYTALKNSYEPKHIKRH